MHDPQKIMQAIFKVHAGLMNASQAMQELKMPGKTCYKWEAKALLAMQAALQPKPPGRPKKQVDQEKEKLRKQVSKMQTELILLEQDKAINKLLFGTISDGVSSKKKPSSQRKRKSEK